MLFQKILKNAINNNDFFKIRKSKENKYTNNRYLKNNSNNLSNLNLSQFNIDNSNINISLLSNNISAQNNIGKYNINQFLHFCQKIKLKKINGFIWDENLIRLNVIIFLLKIYLSFYYIFILTK